MKARYQLAPLAVTTAAAAGPIAAGVRGMLDLVAFVSNAAGRARAPVRAPSPPASHPRTTPLTSPRVVQRPCPWKTGRRGRRTGDALAGCTSVRDSAGPGGWGRHNASRFEIGYGVPDVGRADAPRRPLSSAQSSGSTPNLAHAKRPRVGRGGRLDQPARRAHGCWRAASQRTPPVRTGGGDGGINGSC